MSAVDCNFANHETGPSVHWGNMRIETCTFTNNVRYDWGLWGEGYIQRAVARQLKIEPRDWPDPEGNPWSLERTPVNGALPQAHDEAFAALRHVRTCSVDGCCPPVNAAACANAAWSAPWLWRQCGACPWLPRSSSECWLRHAPQ